MEDDVEVELELEKQLSLAHELFWSKSVVYYLPSWKNKKSTSRTKAQNQKTVP